MTYAPAADAPAVNLSPRQRLEILGAILLALFLFALDQTVVGTALPRIITDLHGEELYTWAVTVYLLTATISGPIYGKLSDLFGRRPIFIWAVGLFLAASVFAATTPYTALAESDGSFTFSNSRSTVPSSASRRCRGACWRRLSRRLLRSVICRRSGQLNSRRSRLQLLASGYPGR